MSSADAGVAAGGLTPSDSVVVAGLSPAAGPDAESEDHAGVNAAGLWTAGHDDLLRSRVSARVVPAGGPRVCVGMVGHQLDEDPAPGAVVLDFCFAASCRIVAVLGGFQRRPGGDCRPRHCRIATGGDRREMSGSASASLVQWDYCCPSERSTQTRPSEDPLMRLRLFLALVGVIVASGMSCSDQRLRLAQLLASSWLAGLVEAAGQASHSCLSNRQIRTERGHPHRHCLRHLPKASSSDPPGALAAVHLKDGRGTLGLHQTRPAQGHHRCLSLAAS